jgi:predicted XRE-type DNA-binding protein
LREFPEDARHDAGYQLDKVQRGEQPDDFKPMPSIGKGVEEIRMCDDTGTYRVCLYGKAGRCSLCATRVPEENAGDGQARHRACQKAIHRIDERCPMTRSKTKTFSSVWDAIADTPEQAANLQARAELMRQIAAIIKAKNWKQADAAAHCGVTQPRINDLLRGRVSRFSLDALVNIATALGRRVHVELEVA